MPAMDAASDAMVVAPLSDHVMVVASPGDSLAQVQHAATSLAALGDRIAGAVLIDRNVSA